MISSGAAAATILCRRSDKPGQRPAHGATTSTCSISPISPAEAASLKRKTRLASAEGKRIFARCFYSFQAILYFVSALGRTKVPHEYVEQIEQAVRNKMDEGTKELEVQADHP